ncbi:hypothetical protein D3C76_975590 [compost metagenome]
MADQRDTQQPRGIDQAQAVGEPAAEQAADRRGRAHHHAGEDARFLQRQPVGTHQERRIPHRQGEGAEGGQRGGGYQQAVIAIAQQFHCTGEHAGRLLLGEGQVVPAPARRFAHQQAEDQGEDAQWHGYEEEAPAPAVHLHQPGADAQAEDRRECRRTGEAADRQRAITRRIEIGHQRQRRRRQRRLGRRHQHARQHQHGETHGEAAEQRRQRPQCRHHGQHADARIAVRQPSRGQAEDDIDRRERQPGDQPHGGVAGAELPLDRLDHHRDDLPADEAAGIGQHQQREHAVGAPAQRAGRLSGHGIRPRRNGA